MTLSIAPIGSCRIVDPLRQARKPFGFEMNRGRSFGFTHSSPEAIQQLKFMRGEIDIPAELWSCVSAFERNEVSAQTHTPADIYLVELSSQKIFTLGDTVLQLNYLRNQFTAFFKDNARKNAYWKAIGRLPQEEIDAFLGEAWSGTPEKDADREILRQIRMSRADKALTRKDMLWLKSELPEVIFVTHVNAEEEGGDRIKTRDEYIQMVKEVAQEEGLTVFDPTESMIRVGQNNAMETDLNHYSEPFKLQLIEDLYDAALRQSIEALVAHQGASAVLDGLKFHVFARLHHPDPSRADAARMWAKSLVEANPELAPLREVLAA